MRIAVTHSTVYRYANAVFLEPHTFRLRPRLDGSVRLLDYTLDISPAPAGRTEFLDQDGNAAVEAWFSEPLEVLTVRSSFQVETLRENPFDYILSSAGAASLPPEYGEPLRAALGPHLAVEGLAGPVREFAGWVNRRAGGQTAAFLTTLNGFLYESFGHVIRGEGLPYPPEVTLRTREGTCRDLAVLFCAACRVAGIAARFVSGYEREAATQPQAYMHAWAEAYLPGGGWRGYDPTQGLAVSQSHVAVAAAADPSLAAPITGTYRGAAPAKMEFAIELGVKEKEDFSHG
jgi:transglutaminase-like putative cysteine protease